ncbi:hypothetical protein IF2G_10981 [Cordyceps javanica]|nr:hypothetical protein IF2G_10981 [Cordyceps javanica]
MATEYPRGSLAHYMRTLHVVRQFEAGVDSWQIVSLKHDVSSFGTIFARLDMHAPRHAPNPATCFSTQVLDTGGDAYPGLPGCPALYLLAARALRACTSTR